jgi:hypothetical protein
MVGELKTYSELIKRSTLVSRFRYAVLPGSVGIETFGFDRHLNQAFYRSGEWKSARDHVLIRDDGCDLGVPGEIIHDRVLVHHMNPIRVEDIVNRDEERLFNPEYLICVSHATHNAIHFGDEEQLPRPFIERRPGDTTLW